MKSNNEIREEVKPIVDKLVVVEGYTIIRTAEEWEAYENYARHIPGIHYYKALALGQPSTLELPVAVSYTCRPVEERDLIEFSYIVKADLMRMMGAMLFA